MSISYYQNIDSSYQFEYLLLPQHRLLSLLCFQRTRSTHTRMHAHTRKHTSLARSLSHAHARTLSLSLARALSLALSLSLAFDPGPWVKGCLLLNVKENTLVRGGIEHISL